LIQSFAVGETTPEQAHEIGKRLAHEILGGQYAYVMSTHVDRDHIHNHFVWCSVNLQTHRRYISNKISYRQIRKASDKICREFGLSVIENPQSRGRSYNKYLEEKRRKSEMKKAVDRIIDNVKTPDEFMKAIKDAGYRLKDINSLGSEYTNAVISHKITENKSPLRRLIRIKANEKIENVPAYKNWSQVQNLKRMARTLVVMEENGVNLRNIDQRCLEATEKISELKNSLKSIEREIGSAKPDSLTGLYARLNEQSLQYYIAKREKKQFETIRSNIHEWEHYTSPMTIKSREKFREER